jgi:hypothetical protein
MASPERGQGPPDPEHHPAPEPEPRPYQRASRFAGERPAGDAYVAAQRVIYEGPPNDLSVYRLQVNRLWHVAALGVLPPAPVLHALEAILDRGEAAELPAEVWQALRDRRAQAIRRAPWSERHFRPGQRLD